MPKGKRGRRPETRVNIQIHVVLQKRARINGVLKTFEYSEHMVEELIQEWIDSGELPPFVTLKYIDWEITEDGRPRRGRIGGDEAERWRESFIQRFRYGLVAKPVSHMGQDLIDLEPEDFDAGSRQGRADHY